jgi:hypothetical protein
MKRPTLIQAGFYSLIFISGFLYQPSWLYENFWAKADFYDSIFFEVPYFVFLLIYSTLLTPLTWVFVKFAKSRL